MAYEVPTDLIRRVQIALRNDAGLSSYDPHDPTLPALPSLEASIAEFDPSPPYLRCNHCKGRLLRGLQSVICIYCGKQLRKDVPPEPIKFKSTSGYRWLLDSLGLDGSEIVGSSMEGNESNRGQSTPKDVISLSDLLDLQITWPAESEEPETSVTSKTLEQSKSSLNLTGVDLDNFFSGSKEDTILNASKEQPVINKQIESTTSKAFAGQDNLSLFQNDQPSETIVRSSEDENGDTYSGWRAGFQSADFGNQHEGSKSFDLFKGSTVDLSDHMDLVFGPGKDLEDKKPKDDSGPPLSMNNDWIQGDPWNNVNPIVSQPAGQFNLVVKAKDGLTSDDLNNHSSMSVDWFQDNQWQTNNTNPPSNKMINEDDDSFDDWNDFTGSTSAQDPSKNAWEQSSDQVVSVNEQTAEINLFSSTDNFQEMNFGSFSQSDLFSGSSSNQNGSTEVNNILSKVPASERFADAKSEVGGDAVQAAKNQDDFTISTQPKDDLEMVMSQMHDLSFMLESNLSVPSKLDGLNSLPQD